MTNDLEGLTANQGGGSLSVRNRGGPDVTVHRPGQADFAC
jgi:hypothetical protein